METEITWAVGFKAFAAIFLYVKWLLPVTDKENDTASCFGFLNVGVIFPIWHIFLSAGRCNHGFCLQILWDSQAGHCPVSKCWAPAVGLC